MKKLIFAGVVAALSLQVQARLVFVAPGAVEYDPARNEGVQDEEAINVAGGKNGETWDSAFPDLPTALKYAKGQGTLYCVKVGEYEFTDKIDWPSTGAPAMGVGGDGVACGVLGGFTGETKKDAQGKPILPGPLATDGRRTKFVFADSVEEPVVRYNMNSWWASFANIDANKTLPVVWISPCMDFMRASFPAKLTGEIKGGEFVHQAGDEITFTYTVDWFVKNGRLRLTRVGDDGVFDEQLLRTDEGPIVYKTKAGAPGSVMVYTALLGEDGNEIGAKGYGHPTLRCDLGVIASPERLSPFEGGKPKDFDEFWGKALKAVRAKTAAEISEVKGRGGVFAYSLECSGERPATGYYTVPEGSAKKSLAAYLTLGDYDPAQRAEKPGSAQKGRINLFPSIHGQQLDGDKAYFEAEKRRLGGYFVNDANAYVERSQMYGIVLRMLRTVEFLKTLPEWNGELHVSGLGQGAYLGLVIAALQPEAVTRLEATGLWLADLSFTRMGRMGGRIPSFTNGSRYYDATSFAPLVKCPVRLSVGALDRFSTPAGVTAAYNLMKCPKKLEIVQGAGHGWKLGEGEVWSQQSADWKEAK